MAAVGAAPPPAPPTHDSFLASLIGAFGDVYLAGRLVDDGLGLAGDGTLRVFLPDLHFMSAACLKVFDGHYRFNGAPLANGGIRPFGALLRVLEGIDASNRQVFQLGDRFDLWREWASFSTVPKGPGTRAVYDRVRNDPAVGPLADRLDGLGTQYVRGNHDGWLSEVDPGLPAAVRSRKSIAPVKNGPLQLEHGRRFDLVELLPDALKAAAMIKKTRVTPFAYKIGLFESATIRTIRNLLRKIAASPGFHLHLPIEPSGARQVTTPADVAALSTTFVTSFDASPLLNVFRDLKALNDYDHLRFFPDYLADAKGSRGVRLVVIGHTHGARIVTGGTSPRVILMDCGGWIENATVVDAASDDVHVVPSRQIGVQLGNDLRVYQLGAGAPA